MNSLLMGSWRDACVEGLGKTYHILVEAIVKLNKLGINAQGNCLLMSSRPVAP